MTREIKKQYEELKSGAYEIFRRDLTEKELKIIASAVNVKWYVKRRTTYAEGICV